MNLKVKEVPDEWRIFRVKRNGLSFAVMLQLDWPTRCSFESCAGGLETSVVLLLPNRVNLRWLSYATKQRCLWHGIETLPRWLPMSPLSSVNAALFAA